MKILGIESSCDESAISIIEIEAEHINANMFFSPNDHIKRKVIIEHIATHNHQMYGGVVPESASRQHFYFLPKMLHEINKEFTMENIDIICATYGPGLIGGLMLGTGLGQTISMVYNKPFFPVDHIKAHALSPLFENPNIFFPYICLIVSGGHTLLLHVQDFHNINILSSTRDDAMGELFDKVAVYMGLSFPGGREIEQLAKTGNERKYLFKQPVCKDGVFGTKHDFSFSGLKTAFIRQIDQIKKDNNGILTEQNKSDIAACLQYTVAQIIKNKFEYSLNTTQCKRFAIAGGVASNLYIRNFCTTLASNHETEIFFPSLKICTDNATMIAWACFLGTLFNEKPTLTQGAKSSLGW